MTFFWYDFETFGPNPRRDRPAQFAGVRTNEALEVVDDPVVFYCRPSFDYLPDPESCLIHGISPVALLEDGLSESAFAEAIHAELSHPDTCAVGFNAIKFDHEVTRFLFYRNLLDPYAWHWRDGCSRWDVIDLFRAAYALRPDGIEWPVRDDGAPSFKLEDIARANGILHESAHDAASDVEATVAAAALVRSAQPALFDYYLGLRDKRSVEPLLDGMCVFVSGLVGAQNGCATLVAPVCRHPDQGRGTIVFDLRSDPSEFAHLSAEELRDLMFTRSEDLPEGATRPRFYEVKTNACPFVAPVSVVDERVQARLGLDLDLCRRRSEDLERIKSTFAPRVAHAYQKTWPKCDVDEALYERLTPDDDRLLLERLRSDGNWNGAAKGLRFKDQRLPELLFRYRARNHTDRLSDEEHMRWKAYCREKLLRADEHGATQLDSFVDRLETLRAAYSEQADSLRVLDQLAIYKDEINVWLEA